MGQKLETLKHQLDSIANNCNECGICVARCAFLQQHGTPKQLAEKYPAVSPRIPFECSLCELCAAVCPHGLNPGQLFLELRRSAFANNATDMPKHKGLRNYEKIGTSKQFSWYSLPRGCDTIFFPGCALAGSRSNTTLKLYRHLQKQDPNIGIVLDCCTKPSHDLGDQGRFAELFGELKAYLLGNGVKTVLVACPNCQKVFSQYASELKTRTVYAQLNSHSLPAGPQLKGEISLHDPCVARFYPETQDAVRSLLEKKGLTVSEPRHTKKTTLCCGLGGGVKDLDSAKAGQWLKKRAAETGGRQTVSYCAACTENLSSFSKSHHLLDLLFEPTQAETGDLRVTKAPFTYINRLKLKRKLRRHTGDALTRERCPSHRTGRRQLSLKKAAIFSLVLAIIIAACQFGRAGY